MSARPLGKHLLTALALLAATGLQAESIVIPSASTAASSSVLPVATEGGACTATPTANTAIRADYSAVLTCNGGTWRRTEARFWKAPVATFAGLPVTNNEVGDVRLVTGGFAGNPPYRAFMWNGASWVAMTIDQNGDMTVPGNLTVTGASTFTGLTRLGGAANTAASATNGVMINITATENTACPNGAADNGKIAKDANGLILSCQSGVWRREVRVTGDTMTGRLSVHTEDWGLVLRNGAGADNAQPQNGVGSAYVNDVYLRSIGRWASQAAITNPVLDLGLCRSSYHALEITACDFRICVSGICGPYNPNGRQILMHQPGY